MPRIQKYYPDLRGKNPNTLPDWRCRRAMEMIHTSQNASLKRDDRQTVEFARFVRKLARSEDRAAENLINRQPDLASALLLATEFRPVAELQARLLADQGSHTIGVAMDLPPAAISWYADLFFDVRPRLRASYWIQFNAIGISPAKTPTPVQLFLQHAYHRGYTIIPAWLDYLANHEGPHDLKTAQGRQRESIQLLIESRTLTPLRTQAAKDLRLNRLFRDIEPEMFRNRSTPAEFSKSLAQAVGGLVFPLKPGTPSSPEPGLVSGKLRERGSLASFLADTAAVRDAVFAAQIRSDATSRLVAQ